MTKDKLIQMVEALKAKQNNAKKVLKHDKLIESQANTRRYIKRIDSVCDRLCFNFNMLPDSQDFLNDTIAEAELFLNA